MENGMYAAVKMDDTVHTVFIDQETLEFGQIDGMVSANRQRKEREEMERQAAADQERKVYEAQRRRIRRITTRIVKQELGLVAAMAVVYGGFSDGLISAAFTIPAMAVLLAVFCFKAGSLFGRIFRHRR